MTDTNDLECDYAGCSQDATLTRVLEDNDDQFDFCNDHDPLEDSGVAHSWTEL